MVPFGRTILYGQLEDETPVGSVRRLATYEDYALRLLADHQVRVAHTYGVVELTPNQEYMLVTEFFENARNLGDAQVDDQVIDDGVAMVRTFWDIGVAPATSSRPTSVKDVHLHLVDVSASSPPLTWRQAVDLSKILLCWPWAGPRSVLPAPPWNSPLRDRLGVRRAVASPSPPSSSQSQGTAACWTFPPSRPRPPAVSIQRWSTQRLLLPPPRLGACS